MNGKSAKELGRLDRAHRRRIEQGVARLRPAVVAALNAYLAVCRRRLDQAAWPQPGLVAAGDATSARDTFTMASADQLTGILGGAAEEWPGILSSKLMPGYAGYLRTLPDDPAIKGNPAIANEVTSWRDEWIGERRQELVGIPDAVTSQLRTELTRLANTNGTSIRDAQHAAQTMLNQGYQSWAGRASLIARTEVNSASNQASLRSWTALADSTGMQANKTWVGGTRPTHSAVSGTTIGIGAKFQVGDSEMNGPGDGAGGPSEVCNCGCSLSYEITDQPQPQPQPESDDGAGGGVGRPARDDDVAASAADEAADEELAVADDDDGGDDAGAADDPGGDDSTGGDEPVDGEDAAEDPEPGADDPDLGELDEDALSDRLGELAVAGDEAGMDKVLAELQRRDDAQAKLERRAQQKRDYKARQQSMKTDAEARERAAQDAEYDRMLDAGVDPEEAFTKAFGQITDDERKSQVIQELRSQGYTGKGWDALTQDVFQREADRMFWVAEAATNGYMLTPAARAAGISDASLFTGPESRARKYASDELKQFWADHGRITVDDVRAGLLGGKSRAASTAYWA